MPVYDRLRHESPALYLDIPVIEFASRIQADFDIDLYANPYDEELDE